MSVAGRNFFKAITGTLIGLGIGAAISSTIRRMEQPAEDRQPFTASVRGWKQNRQMSWNEYWTYLQEAGDRARAEKEEEMRARFREKVNDQNAFRPKPEDSVPAQPDSA